MPIRGQRAEWIADRWIRDRLRRGGQGNLSPQPNDSVDALKAMMGERPLSIEATKLKASGIPL